jgi:hypothetical protein
MDWSGLPVPYVAGGLAALVLLVLMLRFALRPRKVKVVTQTGLGLPSSPTKNSLWGKANAPASAEPVAGGGVSNSAWSPASDGASAASASAGGPGGYRPPERGRESSVTRSPAELAELANPAVAARSVAAGAPGAGNAHLPGSCPKCGGRFLQGEMEGPTLMVDGVVREDFQPLLTACECAVCGYLEFYTRPVRG